MNKKLFLMLLLTIGVASCGTEKPEQVTFASAVQSLTGQATKAQTSQTVDNIRRQLTPEVRQRFGNNALLIARLESRDQASVLIQSGVNRDVETYVTPDGISLSLRDGVLVGTRGLGFDLMNTDVSETAISNRGRAVRVHRYLDGESKIVIKSYICDYRGVDPIVESCKGKDTQFQNSYRVSASEIVASRQWIGPEVGYIQIELP
ncbi:YjbF family lipoprotein [Sulfitobacter sp. SH24]|uniref:YjbF family lipoprotein n=1 Tax=Sulfitobacter sp. SH24 TaxID=3421173 RepID=UPI003F505715